MPSILIVDDDEVIRDALSELFSERYLCHIAASAEEALTRLAAREYDVVITDINMPGMSGEDLLGFVKTYQPWAPVIFISGATDSQHAERFRSKAFGYLVKPFALSTVEQMVDRAFEQRQRTQEQRQRMMDQGRKPTTNYML